MYNIRVRNRDSADTHYDPSREDHAKFEQEIRSAESLKETKENNVTVEVPAEDKHVACTQEKFYSVSDSLKGFFDNKDQVTIVHHYYDEFYTSCGARCFEL